MRPDSEAGLVLVPSGDSAWREAIRSADGGAVEAQAFVRRETVDFDRMHPLNWVLVRVAPNPDDG